MGKGGDKLQGGVRVAESLVAVLSDGVLRDAFSYFLEERHTEENLQLWLALEDFNEMRNEQEKEAVFNNICRTFILPDCSTPVNYASSAIELVRDAHKNLSEGGLPLQVFHPLRRACWDQLLFTCFPPFLESGIYADFLEGVIDSTQVGFSRRKAEKVFGMKIEGPLRRQEVIEVISVGMRHGGGIAGFLGRNFGLGKKKQKKQKEQTSGLTLGLSYSERRSSNVSQSIFARKTSTQMSSADLAKMPNLGGDILMTDEEADGDAPMGIFGLM